MITLYIAVPFLISMIILYIPMTTYPSEPSAGEDRVHCVVPRIVGIVRKPYEDDREMELQCTGLIISKNVIVTLGECLPSGRNVFDGNNSNYFVTSGSKYWSKFYNLHRVVSSELIQRDVGALLIDGEFPACLRKEGINLIKSTKAKNYSVKGWKHNNRKMYVPLTEKDVPVVQIGKYCDYLGGSVFVDTKYLFGLVSKRCDKEAKPITALNEYYQSLKTIFPQNDIQLEKRYLH
ncbi:hypothetical protein JTB14_013602 [Gonioctena quinquepunctata]|nr:hypothetical protein JTB14_013602 [Gonioctena quinquepunctata]